MTNMHSRMVAGACPIVFTLITGCHQAATPPVTPVAYQAPLAVVVAVAPPSAPPATAVHVARDILTACAIDDAPKGSAPLFAFDSAALSSDDRRLLGEVATCLITGPLAGRTLTLVGRADPRGTEEYNTHLGDRRASRVESYLEHHGMTVDKLSETSRGALDATGQDESGWMMDRRVDVNLAAKSVEVAVAR